jgi:hypothetical protein
VLIANWVTGGRRREYQLNNQINDTFSILKIFLFLKEKAKKKRRGGECLGGDVYSTLHRRNRPRQNVIIPLSLLPHSHKKKGVVFFSLLALQQVSPMCNGRATRSGYKKIFFNKKFSKKKKKKKNGKKGRSRVSVIFHHHPDRDEYKKL